MSAMENANASSLARISKSLLHQCKPNYRLKWLKNKGAILIVVWSFMVNSVFHFLMFGLPLLLAKSPETTTGGSSGPGPAGIVLIFLALLFPLGGWLADSYLGRHKMIRYSTWLMWVSIITMIVWYLLCNFAFGGHLSSEVQVAVNVVLNVGLGLGLEGFQANIIQLGIDQLTEASSVEITSFITSYVFTLYTSGVTFHFIGSCKSTELHVALLMMLYVAVCLTLAVCVDFIFESSLIKERLPITTNSVSLIAKVTRYVIRNRYRSLGETDRSVFDVAKRNYGGPFENQHVEHVKIFFRMMFVVAIGSVVGGQIIILSYAQGKLQLRFADWKESSCYVQLTIQYGNYVVGTILIVLYEIVIYPLFNKCIPTVRTTTVYLVSIFFCFLKILTYLSIEIRAFLEQSGHNITNGVSTSCSRGDDSYAGIQFSSLWILVADSLEGLYTLLLILSGYTFLWSQAPSNMKGLVIGMMYAFLGLNVGVLAAISTPFIFVDFSWNHVLLSCGAWYYMIQAMIVVIIGTVSVFAVKYYKKCQQTNIHLSSVSLNGPGRDPA